MAFNTNEQRKVTDLFPVRVKLAEVMRNIYQVTVEPGTSREDLLKPEYWKNVCKQHQFQPYTRLEVVTDDGEYWAELMVITAGTNWAKVIELRYIPLTNVDIIQESSKFNEFELKFRGPHCKWSVMRKSDGEVIKEGFTAKDEAASYLSSYVKSLSK